MDKAFEARRKAYEAFEFIPRKHQNRAVEIARRGQAALDLGKMDLAENEFNQMAKLAVMGNPMKPKIKTLPGLLKWNMYAAYDGKHHNYDIVLPEGRYTIQPQTLANGRFHSFILNFVNDKGYTGGGLHQHVATSRDARVLVGIAAKHYADLLKSGGTDYFRSHSMQNPTGGRYEVIVGNIGSVYYGGNLSRANAIFNTYVDQSNSGYGRASGESVTLFDRGEIKKEHIGPQDSAENLFNPGGKLEPFHSGKRPGYQNVNRQYLRKLGLKEDMIDRMIARQYNGASLKDAYYAETKRDGTNPKLRSYPEIDRESTSGFGHPSSALGYFVSIDEMLKPHGIHIGKPSGMEKTGFRFLGPYRTEREARRVYMNHRQSFGFPTMGNPKAHRIMDFYTISPATARKLIGGPLPKQGTEKLVTHEGRDYFIGWTVHGGKRLLWIREHIADMFPYLSGQKHLKDPLENPRQTKIYQHCLKIFASKKGMPHKCDDECKAHDHNYVHEFENDNICIFGLPDGSILTKG